MAEEQDSPGPVHIIVNPLSGYGGQKLILGRVLGVLSREGIDFVRHVTSGPGHATRLARAAADTAGTVIPWGGDGTVNEVARGLIGSPTPLLCVHAGTENLLAKELRMPKKPENIVETLTSRRIMEFDIGTINDRTFLSIVGVGFDAEVVRRVSAERTGHISHLSYFWPIWRTFWEHDFPRIAVSADGEDVFAGEGLVFVGNIRRYSSGLRICSRASCNDGKLDLVVFKCGSQGRLVIHSLLTLLNRHPVQRDVIYRTAQRIRVSTEKPLTCEVDGDVGPVTPLDIAMSRQKIRLLLPRRTAGISRLIDRIFPYRYMSSHGTLSQSKE